MNRGPLLCLDTFTTPAANGPPKMKPFTVFLFEQILIFSEIVGKKTQFTSPVYVYKAHFLVRANSCLAWLVADGLFAQREIIPTLASPPFCSSYEP